MGDIGLNDPAGLAIRTERLLPPRLRRVGLVRA